MNKYKNFIQNYTIPGIVVIGIFLYIILHFYLKLEIAALFVVGVVILIGSFDLLKIPFDH